FVWGGFGVVSFIPCGATPAAYLRLFTSYGGVGEAGGGGAPQRVAELEERIAILTQLRDSLVHRMPWLAAPDDGTDEQAA
ncbi:hypothetical protein ACI2LP_13205, partial [Streptomyces sp. NPDC019890]